MNYKTFRDLPDISGVPVLVRLDLNAPVKDGVVVDDYRIRKSLPTIRFLKEKGAKVVIVSHIEGGADTLRPAFERLSQDIPLTFCEDCIESGAAMVEAMKPGDVVLCENLRLYDGEKKNDPEFARSLASLATLYVNDAFSVSHRKHASIVGVPKLLPSFAGLQLEEEIKNLSVCFNPQQPFVFVLGGAKFDTKMPLVSKFLESADTVVIAGALSNDIFKARGMNIGRSRVSDGELDLSSIERNLKILVPTDVVVENEKGEKRVCLASDIASGEMVRDAGPEFLATLTTLLKNARMILWNGPLGYYENGYKEPTLALAHMIADTDAVSIVGGGDTLAAIAELGIEDKFTFVSTGGGAMLDFLAEGTLPGIEALKRK